MLVLIVCIVGTQAFDEGPFCLPGAGRDGRAEFGSVGKNANIMAGLKEMTGH